MKQSIRLPTRYFFGLAFLGLHACSGGSGQQTVQNDDFSDPLATTEIRYAGPSAATADVTNYKLNFWDNLAGADRCGACHNQAAGQQPMFLRSDDINLAYAVTNDLVDLSVPSSSRLVVKAASGHNCWSGEPAVCADIISNYIQAWASDSGATGNVVVLSAPEQKTVGASRSFPTDALTEGINATSFASTVYPLLSQHCASCHSEDSDSQQQPYFGSRDIDVAYSASQSRIQLDDPVRSRFVARLGEEFHNCWSSCSADVEAMMLAITDFANGIEVSEIDPALQVSNAMSLNDGLVINSGGRVETNVIALYEFMSDSQEVVFDTSGVEPAMDLNLVGNVERVGGGGIRIHSGKAQAATSSSRKLYQFIRSTGEYAIEAWLVPDNVTQEGPARIVSYSGGSNLRNFTLGQSRYNYNFMNRSSVSDANGIPLLSTGDDEQILQATLQHVVANYDPVNGSNMYVNGQLVASDRGNIGSNIAEWDDTFAFILGNEADNQYSWQGTIRFLAIHNRVLTHENIMANFNVGVGQKFYLLFGVSEHVTLPQSYIVFQVEQFDNYSYLFKRPFFISLSNQSPVDDIVIQGMRIGVNGKEASVGQSFGKIDMRINANNYNSETGVPLSDLGAVINLGQGPDNDEFFLSFDRIGNSVYRRVEPSAERVPAVTNLPNKAKIGLRNFAEIGATMAKVTSVPFEGENRVLFESVYQQLPVDEDAEGFVAAHQSGVMQLAIGYCHTLATDTILRSAYFPELNFAANFNASNLDAAMIPILTALTANEIDDNGADTALTTQPDLVDVREQVNTLMTTPEMAEATTEAKVTAICASILGSAVMLIQ